MLFSVRVCCREGGGREREEGQAFSAVVGGWVGGGAYFSVLLKVNFEWFYVIVES